MNQHANPQPARAEREERGQVALREPETVDDEEVVLEASKELGEPLRGTLPELPRAMPRHLLVVEITA